jgi:RNase P subunit RPR2
MDDGVLLSNHLLALAQCAFHLDPRLSRVYGERLSTLALEEKAIVSDRQFCERCSMLQVQGVTSRVSLSSASGARSVQKLRGSTGVSEPGIVATACLVCGHKGAVWSHKKKKSTKRVRQEVKPKKPEPKKKHKKKKLETLSAKVTTADAKKKNASFGSLDDWLC